MKHLFPAEVLQRITQTDCLFGWLAAARIMLGRWLSPDEHHLMGADYHDQALLCWRFLHPESVDCIFDASGIAKGLHYFWSLSSDRTPKMVSFATAGVCCIALLVFHMYCISSHICTLPALPNSLQLR